MTERSSRYSLMTWRKSYPSLTRVAAWRFGIACIVTAVRSPRSILSARWSRNSGMWSRTASTCKACALGKAAASRSHSSTIRFLWCRMNFESDCTGIRLRCNVGTARLHQKRRDLSCSMSSFPRTRATINSPQPTGFMSPANTRTVLLIDDELSAVDLYALAIGEHFRVLTATTARAGYALAQQERPDAIVIDMLLPDLHGLDLSRRLSEDARTTAIPRI